MTALAALRIGDETGVLRRATAEDLLSLVDLIAADQLGAGRDGVRTSEDLRRYRAAFDAIDTDRAQLLVVAQMGAEVAGTLQLTFIPGLARRGSLRAQIEAVRVHARLRGLGLGSAMLIWAIEEARRQGCSVVQLTTDKVRLDARRFYERLGFNASHEGMKLQL